MNERRNVSGKAQSGPGESAPDKRWTSSEQECRARFTPHLDAFDWGTIALVVVALAVIFSGLGA